MENYEMSFTGMFAVNLFDYNSAVISMKVRKRDVKLRNDSDKFL